MTDIPPRRAMTLQERETLSTPEDISRALSQPAKAAPARFIEEPSPEYLAAMKACASVSERSVVALRDAVDTTQSKTDMLGAMVGFLIAELELLERKVAKLEARPAVKHAGVWREATQYAEGNLVTHSGSLWCAASSTQSRPGSNSEWQLCVKRGEAPDVDAARRSARSSR